MAASPGGIDLAGLPNPFTRSVIADAWSQPEGDVADINREPFEECLRLIEQVSSSGASTGLLLTGYQGAGKTHLLARLRAHLAANLPPVVFIYTRLETSASHLRRFLRRRFVDNLLRPDARGRGRLAALLAARGDDAGFDAWLEAAGFDFNLGQVLRHYRAGRHRRLCVQWLAGDSLPDSALSTLDLGRDSDDEDSLEDRAQQMIEWLALLARPAPVVLCCDQVEALEAYPGDRRGLYAYAQTAAALHDSIPNLLVVSCMQSFYYDTLVTDFPKQLQERIWKQRTFLRPVNWSQARAMLLTRLANLPALAKSVGGGSLWPLEEDDFGDLFEFDACLARQVIYRAEQVFERRRGGQGVPPAEPDSLPDFLHRRFERLREAALGHLAEPIDTVLAHGLPKLLSLVGIQEKARPEEHARTVDLVCGDAGVTAAVCFCHQHRSALPRRLKRITEAKLTEAYDRVILLRPASTPIGARAVQTRQHLEGLQAAGAVIVQPSAEAMAALDALRQLLSDAQSGDLTFGGQTLAAESVAEWLSSNLPESLERLVDEMAGEAPAADSSTKLAQNLLDYIAEHHVVRASQAAEALQATEEEVLDCARHHTAQVGILAGPPAVVFEFVPEGLADESH